MQSVAEEIVGHAVVTGASSGIGLAISERLLRRGFRVFGLARDFGKCRLEHERFEKMACDVSRVEQLESAAEAIRQRARNASGKAEGIHLLVNNAGIGIFGPHEQLSAKKLAQLVQTNLQAPLVLTGLFLRDLKKTAGHLINISSVTAKKASTHGCAYAATKAGLTHFGTSLFEEVRKTGLRVTTIHPDLTNTAFYELLDFSTTDEPDTYITAQCVADAVEQVLEQRQGTVITELTVRPQRVGIRRK